MVTVTCAIHLRDTAQSSTSRPPLSILDSAALPLHDLLAPRDKLAHNKLYALRRIWTCRAHSRCGTVVKVSRASTNPQGNYAVGTFSLRYIVDRAAWVDWHLPCGTSTRPMLSFLDLLHHHQHRMSNCDYTHVSAAHLPDT
jgi:hypothetical protein